MLRLFQIFSAFARNFIRFICGEYGFQSPHPYLFKTSFLVDKDDKEAKS